VRDVPQRTIKGQESLKLKHAAAIATTLVILAGFAMISPLYLQTGRTAPQPKVMLGFTVSDHGNVLKWCQELSSVLNRQDIGATVFVSGRAADTYPHIFSYFSDRVDVGSEAYDNIDLTGIPDYAAKLKEVQSGKNAVDSAGNLVSRIFRAPFSATDQDIYSLLSRSGILVDFSYNNQYNVYQKGQFIRYAAAVYQGRDYSPDYLATLVTGSKPVIILFDNAYPVSSIEIYISALKNAGITFANASELTGFVLTDRR
jgi:peptidoglycan/xylan/chitin deacetylase (PgdA/CDA1 family)